MSVLCPRSHSFDSPNASQQTGWQMIRRRGHSQNARHDDDHRRKRRWDASQPSEYPQCFPRNRSLSREDESSSSTSPKFAMTPAEFNLFPRTRCAGSSARHSQTEDHQQGHRISHINSLRSTAFGELHRSIAENGEGLIRRMRDYEHFRSHHHIRQAAKRFRKRGRKSLPQRSKSKPSVSPNISDASDDDDVLICSGGPSNDVLRWPVFGGRARSLDAMDVDDAGDKDNPRRAARSPPCKYAVKVNVCNNEDCTITYNATSKDPDLESVTSYSAFTSLSTSSSVTSLLNPQSSISTTSDDSCHPPTTSSEKALAALNIALANGACNISDYSPVWTYQQQFNTDAYDTGDLWR